MVLARCEVSNIVLNWETCNFLVTEWIVLGHKVSKSVSKVHKAKVEVSDKFPPPITNRFLLMIHQGFFQDCTTQVQSFGEVGEF